MFTSLQKILRTVVLVITPVLYTLPTHTETESWWEKITQELRGSGAVFKTGQHLGVPAADVTTVQDIVTQINHASETTRRSWYTWFGSQQDIVAQRFNEVPKPYTYVSDDTVYTFKVDIPASAKVWQKLSDSQKIAYDNSPPLVVMLTAANRTTAEEATFGPVLIGKSRKNGYMVEAFKQ